MGNRSLHKRVRGNKDCFQAIKQQTLQRSGGRKFKSNGQDRAREDKERLRQKGMGKTVNDGNRPLVRRSDYHKLKKKQADFHAGLEVKAMQ